MNAAADTQLRELLRAQAAPITAQWHARLVALGGNYLRGLTPQTELHVEMQGLLEGLGQALGSAGDGFEHDANHPLAAAVRAAGQLRAARGFTTEESLQFLQSCKETLVDAVLADVQAVAAAPSTAAATRRVERLMDRCVLILAASFVATRENVIQCQAESLREVSTPVITLWDSMLLLPLVGIVDSVRAQQISERLLEAIARTEAEVTLIDVTGVPVMDTSVARHILKTVSAAEMLGTRVILTGISPSTAQTMVKLGIDMSGVPTRASLKGGMALALSCTGRAIVAAAKE